MDYSSLVQRCKDLVAQETSVKDIILKYVMLDEMRSNGMISRFEERFLPKFEVMARRFLAELVDINDVTGFDQWHARFLDTFQKEIKDDKGDDTVQGEAQRPINLFLKAYVDRTSQPSAKVAKTLRPFLHVPLHNGIPPYFRLHYRQDYNRWIKPIHDRINQLVKKAVEPKMHMSDSYLSDLRNLSSEEYLSWQAWFREIHPEKPVLLANVC